MNITPRRLAIALASLLLSLPLAANAETPLTIATASPAGVYHVVGRALCRALDTPCRATPSDGSSANLRALRGGELMFALAQSDLHQYAAQGIEGFREAGPDTSLRSIFSLHSEPFTLVVRRRADIKGFEDLHRRSVNIGNPGSGQRGTMEVVMEAMGWSMDDFPLASELKSAEQSQALCDNKIDAMVFTVGHPSGSIQEATTACDAVLVEVWNDDIEKLVDENPYYRQATIPGGMYRGNDEDTTTFGVGATFVTSADVSEDVVYKVVKAVFENFDQFKGLHPAFAVLKKEEMVSDGLSAPLHDGAKRYYEEAGLQE